MKMKMKMMKKKNCELCKRIARMHCDSDQASLCWSCDFNVHSANFLVARHSRTLLCHVCQSPTPWSATGAKLCPTFSVCLNCLRRNRNDEGIEPVVEEGGEEENQVVPWSEITLPPPASSSSNSVEEEEYDSASSSSCCRDRRESRRKRMRKNVSDLGLDVKKQLGPAAKRRRLEPGRIGLSKSVKGLHRQEIGSPTSEDTSAVDCDSSECS